MRHTSIQILPFGFSYHHMLDKLVDRVHNQFLLVTHIKKSEFDFSYSYDPSRAQYNSTYILKGLLNINEIQNSKIIGITDVDLFIPILTFVFGEAQLDGHAAVVSTFRLQPEYYGLPADETLLYERLERETIHELGHTFGLRHCENFECVMTSSMTADDIDIKSANFCQSCKKELFG